MVFHAPHGFKPVALGFHPELLDMTSQIVVSQPQLRLMVIMAHHSVVIQRQALHLMTVVHRHEYLFGSEGVSVKSSQTGGSYFDPSLYFMAVQVHEQSAQAQVVGWHRAVQTLVVYVFIGGVLSGPVEVVEIVDYKEHIVVFQIVKLFKQFGDGVLRKSFIFNS